MGDNGRRSSNEQSKRRKLNTSELAAEDAPTNRIPLPGGQVRQVRPAAPSNGRKAQPGQTRRDATGSVGPRPTVGATPPPSLPRKSQPARPATSSKRANPAPLVPPVVAQPAAPQTLVPRRTAMSTRRKVSLIVLAVVLLLLGTAGWWVLGRYEVAKQTLNAISVPTFDEVNVGPNGEILTSTPVNTLAPGATPVAIVPRPRPQPQSEPVNILLLGLDHRPSDTGAPNTDVMIVVHIDPVAKKVVMLSVPRDLWVPIPELGGPSDDRINAAYGYGVINSIPGGGPAMAKAVIKYNLGIQIDYFAEVQFTGFQKIVDTLGGINVDVPKPLVDNQFPTVDNGLARILVFGGIQHMDGVTALEYARSRHQDSDLGRNKRQQQVLLAIKERGLDIFNTLSNIDALMGNLSDSIRTDLSPDQILSLVTLAPSIPNGNITQAGIAGDMVTETIMPDTGADVLMPNWDKIRPLVAQLFGGNSVALEAARIKVLNGTKVTGLATRTAQMLSDKGFKVIGTDNDNSSAHPTTTIIDYANKSFTDGELAKALGLDPSIVQHATNGPPDADIVVTLGDDKSGAVK